MLEGTAKVELGQLRVRATLVARSVRRTVNIECCGAALVDVWLREIHRSYSLYADTAYRDCNVQLQEGCMGGVDNGTEGDVRVLQSRGVSPSQGWCDPRIQLPWS